MSPLQHCSGALALVFDTLQPLVADETEQNHLEHARKVLTDLLAVMGARSSDAPADPSALQSPALSLSLGSRTGSLRPSGGSATPFLQFRSQSPRTESGGIGTGGRQVQGGVQNRGAKQSVSLMGKSEHEKLEMEAEMLLNQASIEDQEEERRTASVTKRRHPGLQRGQSSRNPSLTPSRTGSRNCQNDNRRTKSALMQEQSIGNAAAVAAAADAANVAPGADVSESGTRVGSGPLARFRSGGADVAPGSPLESKRHPGPSSSVEGASGILTAGAAPRRRGSLQHDENERIAAEAEMLTADRARELRHGELERKSSFSLKLLNFFKSEPAGGAAEAAAAAATVGAASATTSIAGAPRSKQRPFSPFINRGTGEQERTGSTIFAPTDRTGSAQAIVMRCSGTPSRTSSGTLGGNFGTPNTKHKSQVAPVIDVGGAMSGMAAVSLAAASAATMIRAGDSRTGSIADSSRENSILMSPRAQESVRHLSQGDVDPYAGTKKGDGNEEDEGPWMRKKKRQAAMILKHERGELFSTERVVHPHSNALRWWNGTILLWVSYSAIVMPLTMGFRLQRSWLWLDYIMEVQFLVDIAINFHTGFVDLYTSDVVLDLEIIRRHYIRTWLPLDAVGSIPVELLGVMLGTFLKDLAFLKVLRLTKLFRLVRLLHLKAFADLDDNVLINPSLLRLFRLIFSFLLIVHFVTCAYWGLVSTIGPHKVPYALLGTHNVTVVDYPDGDYLSSDQLLQWLPDMHTYEGTLRQRYGFAMHWALLTLLGSDTLPHTAEQHYFTNACLLLGICVFASIIGSASSLLSNLDAYAESKKTQLDSVKHYLRYRRVPKNVQQRICQYFEYLWVSGQSIHHKRMFDELPESLSLMLNLSLKRQLIENCPMFRSCSAVSVVAVIRRLIPCIAMPEEMLAKQGETGDRMFFVVRGALQVFLIQPDGRTVVVNSLGEGAQFGELALLSPDNKRTACVMALTFCELEVLTDVDFHELEEMYPDIAQHVKEEATQHKKKTRKSIKIMRERKETVDDEEHKEEGAKVGKQRPAKAIFRRGVSKLQSVRALASLAKASNKGGADSTGGVAGGAKRFSGAKMSSPGAKADEVMAAALANAASITASPGAASRRGLDDPGGAAWNPTRMPAGDGCVTGTWNQSSKSSTSPQEQK